jgi:hypothetical protein
MIRSDRVGTVLLGLILTGCAAARPQAPASGGYDFIYQELTFRIESYSPPGMIGYNQLIRREGDQVVLLAVDREQDGSLDQVVRGNVTLDEARRIYSFGLLEGTRRGLVRNMIWSNDFSTVIDRRTCVLTTYVLAVGEVYNKLTIVNADIGREEGVVVDLGADGSVDLVESGSQERAYYQTLYTRVLQKGMEAGAVTRSGGTYRVGPGSDPIS